MLCTFTRTHCLGEKRPDRDPGPTITGIVHMYSVFRDDLKRYVRVMTMDSLATSAQPGKALSPTCYSPSS